MSELTKALIAAQNEFPPAIKDSENPFFSSGYLSLAGTWALVGPILRKHGLTVHQAGKMTEHGPVMSTVLEHTSGEKRESDLPIVTPKATDPQAIGAAITYMRRYGLQAMVGICPEDDDGNTAAGRSNAPGSPKAAAPVSRVAPTRDRRSPAKSEGTVPLDESGDPVAVMVEKIDIYKGKAKNTGKPFTKYTVELSDGRSGATFDDAVALLAEKARREQIPVIAGIEQDGKYFNLIGLDLVQSSLGGPVAPGDEPPVEAYNDDDLPF